MRKAKDILDSWSHIFSTGPTDLSRTDLVEHKTKLTDDTPFKEPYRRIPPALYKKVRLEQFSHQKVLFIQMVFWSEKKVGNLLFCIDFRKLNSRTVKDAYMLPRIDDTIDTLLDTKYFSKLDLRSGYWQVEMKEVDKEKTAFTVGYLGIHHCNRMVFGLTNYPATFQRLMVELNLKKVPHIFISMSKNRQDMCTN